MPIGVFRSRQLHIEGWGCAEERCEIVERVGALQPRLQLICWYQ